jgi:PPOX class probable F420-dependent enzyme
MPRTTLEDRDRALLSATNFCHVSTTREDGTIHTVPIWVDVEGENVVLNTEKSRAWPANLRRTGNTTLTVLNMENPYEYLTITGHLAEETEDGALEHIDAMAKKYIGQDTYPFHQDGDVRVILRIAPDRVHRHSPD